MQAAILPTFQRITNLLHQPALLLKQRRLAEALLPKGVRQNASLSDFADCTLALATCCFTAVEQQFGENAMHPRLISGAVEHGLPATYHNGTHTRVMMMRDSLAYARMRRLYDGPDSFPDRDLILLVLAASVHDAIQGNGRGVDERLSADLVVELMQQSSYAYTEEDQEKARHAILATAFDPLTKKQSVTLDRPYPHIQEALAIGDLLSLCRPDGPVFAIAHAPESFFAKQGSYDQIPATETAKDGFSLQGKTVRQCLAYIGSNELLHERFGTFLQDQVAFFRSQVYQDPRVEEWSPSRTANANFLSYKLTPDYEAGLITPLQAYDFAQERARILFAA